MIIDVVCCFLYIREIFLKNVFVFIVLYIELVFFEKICINLCLIKYILFFKLFLWIIYLLGGIIFGFNVIIIFFIKCEVEFWKIGIFLIIFLCNCSVSLVFRGWGNFLII